MVKSNQNENTTLGRLHLDFFFFFKQIFFKLNNKSTYNFFTSVVNFVNGVSFDELPKLVSYLFLVTARHDHKPIFKFLELFGGFTIKMGLKGYSLSLKGKLSWKALSRKKKKKIVRGNTSRTNTALSVSGGKGHIRIITGTVGVKAFFYS